ncbi:hypothetical protein [uncultured Fibrobacter sp.]|uniref:hypothetical protein n=1 Tax=uncultured Fibrobacter sp. TaxID=261512 RepID=UPI002804A9F7|nr:hypothetical protein [uncultured Fibrobacter sp.]
MLPEEKRIHAKDDLNRFLSADLKKYGLVWGQIILKNFDSSETKYSCQMRHSFDKKRIPF